MRYVLATLALVSFLHSSAALGQDDASELGELKQQNELLQAKLEAANLKIEKLETQLAELKGDKDKKDKEKPRSLSDVLVEETILPMETTGTLETTGTQHFVDRLIWFCTLLSSVWLNSC